MVSVCLGSKVFKGVNIGFSVNFWMNGYDGMVYQQIRGDAGVVGVADTLDVEFNFRSEKSFEISGLNFNVGILVEIVDGVRLGGVYKSAFDADVSYTNLATGTAFSSYFNPQEIEDRQFSSSTTLEWPETWGVGLAVQPEDQLTFSLDYTRTAWSEAILRNYNNAETDEREIDVFFPTMNGVNSVDFRQQIDTEQIRFGIEYIYIGESVLIPFRLGIFTDSQFYKDSSAEKITFLGITGGIGVKWGPFSFDVALVYESGNFLEANNSYAASSFDEFKIFASTIISL